MVKIVSSKDENGYKKILDVESSVCADKPCVWHWHYGGIGVDRYFFGEENSEVYDYGKLIYDDNKLIGYALVDLDEFQFIVSLLPDEKSKIKDVVTLLENEFPKGNEINTVCNDSNTIEVLKSMEYKDNGECTFSASINLKDYEPKNIIWENEEIRLITHKDTFERAKYSGLPTGGVEVTEKRIEQYLETEDAKNVLDFVVVDRNNGNLIGYYSWWIDSESNTAMLNPVACIEEYRRRGISKRAILHGLNVLKDKHIDYAYVDTSYSNIPAQNLYKSVGFKKCSEIIEMCKVL